MLVVQRRAPRYTQAQHATPRENLVGKATCEAARPYIYLTKAANGRLQAELTNTARAHLLTVVPRKV